MEQRLIGRCSSLTPVDKWQQPTGILTASQAPPPITSRFRGPQETQLRVQKKLSPALAAVGQLQNFELQGLGHRQPAPRPPRLRSSKNLMAAAAAMSAWGQSRRFRPTTDASGLPSAAESGRRYS